MQEGFDLAYAGIEQVKRIQADALRKVYEEGGKDVVSLKM